MDSFGAESHINGVVLLVCFLSLMDRHGHHTHWSRVDDPNEALALG
jgi:hypothetical protein